jgi:hypothetical protein
VLRTPAIARVEPKKIAILNDSCIFHMIGRTGTGRRSLGAVEPEFSARHFLNQKPIYKQLPPGTEFFRLSCRPRGLILGHQFWFVELAKRTKSNDWNSF